MSILAQALNKCGIKLIGDKLPVGKRKQVDFQKFVSEIREAEAAQIDEQQEAAKQLAHALQQNVDLKTENGKLQGELFKFRLETQLSLINGLDGEARNKVFSAITS